MSKKNNGGSKKNRVVEDIELLELEDGQSFDEDEIKDYQAFEAKCVEERKQKKKPLEVNKKEKASRNVVVSKKVKKSTIHAKKRRSFLSERSIFDRIVACTGALVMIFAMVTGFLYVGVKKADTQMGVWAELEKEFDYTRVIGESGLLAVADAHGVRMAAMLQAERAAEEPVLEFEEKELQRDSVEVEMHLSSMQRDLKIKFVNKDTKKLIPNFAFAVTAKDAAKKTYDLLDDDMDGVIYVPDIGAGICNVTMIQPTEATHYIITTDEAQVSIKDKIEYKKVDIADEVKKESEINASKEDTKKQETTVESSLTNTVEWIQSNQTAAPGATTPEGYIEVPKDKITDPATYTKNNGFSKLAAVVEVPPGGAGVPAEQPPVAVTVGVNHTALDLKQGETIAITAVTVPEGRGVAFSSADGSVASVVDGTITALKVGTTQIVATTETGHTAVCTVTVSEQPKPSVVLDQSALTIVVGKTGRTNAQVSHVQDVGITWSIDNGAVATIAVDGTITAVAVGTATVTATCNADASVKATCAVTVQANPEKDGANRLKDNEGNQLYVKESDGTFREAVYADYYVATAFYKQAKQENQEVQYTGWQTIDGKTYFFDANGTKITGEQVIQGAKYNFGSDGALANGSGNLGIDVSKWNADIDWNAVKSSGISYVIIRCGYRGSSGGALIEDPKFRANIKGATAAGLQVGVYFFSQAINEVEAVEEASMVLQMISGYQISYPVFLDVEPSGGRADSMSKEARTAVCQAFCQTIQNSGYKAGIYANKNWFTTKINTGSLTGYKIWLAQYAAAPTYTATKYDMWQYSSTGRVAGIKGDVDLNISYMGY